MPLGCDTTNKFSTRAGGKALVSNKPHKILVDVREFRSKLPANLYYKVSSFNFSSIINFIYFRDLKFYQLL